MNWYSRGRSIPCQTIFVLVRCEKTRRDSSLKANHMMTIKQAEGQGIMNWYHWEGLFLCRIIESKQFFFFLL